MSAPGAPTRDHITATWTFAGTWDPERTDQPKIVAVEAQSEGRFVVTFSEPVTAKGRPRLAFASGEFAELGSGSGTNKLEFAAGKPPVNAARSKLDFNGGAIIACEAGAMLRVADATMPSR